MSGGGEFTSDGIGSASNPQTLDSREFSLACDAFLLDVDGTILDIAPTSEAVHVPRSLVETLSLLGRQSCGAVALVSGREIAVLDRLFAPLVLATIGCHGAEWRPKAEGPVEERRAPLPVEIKRTFRAIVADQPGIRIEDKGYTLAFHYRSTPELEAAVAERLRDLVAHSTELRLLYGKSVIEVKARDFDKGEAIRELMRTFTFANRRPVFVGDDTTDEDAFATVHALGGIGISVGRPMAGAALMLSSPHAARVWLARIARLAPTG